MEAFLFIIYFVVGLIFATVLVRSKTFFDFDVDDNFEEKILMGLMKGCIAILIVGLWPLALLGYVMTLGVKK